MQSKAMVNGGFSGLQSRFMENAEVNLNAGSNETETVGAK